MQKVEKGGAGLGTRWSLAFPWAAWAADGPELQCWAQLSPGPVAVSSFVPAALPALRRATQGQGLEWGEAGLGPGIWEETETFVGIWSVPAPGRAELWQPRTPQGSSPPSPSRAMPKGCF